MKKVFALMAIVLTVSSFSANAQQPGMAGMQQMFRQRMIDSLKFTPVQADSVLAVQQEFMPQMRAIRMNDNLSAADKMQQFSALRDQEKARFSKFLSDDQLQKLQQLQQAMHPPMQMMKQVSPTPAQGGN
jgi:hypothetical protein